MSGGGGPGLDARHLEDLRKRVRDSAFHQWAGLDLTSIGAGTAEVGLALEPHHLNPQGIVRAVNPDPEALLKLAH